MTDVFILHHTGGEVADRVFESSGEAKMAAGQNYRYWIKESTNSNIQIPTQVWREGRWHNVQNVQHIYKIIRRPGAMPRLLDCANMTFEKENTTVSTYDEAVARSHYLRNRAEVLHAKKGKAEARISKLEDNVENYENELANLTKEIEGLAAVPEPTDYDLVSFTKLFQGTQPYKYAAVRSGSMWYMTGTNNSTRGGRTWEQVVKHIRGGERAGRGITVKLFSSNEAVHPAIMTIFPI